MRAFNKFRPFNKAQLIEEISGLDIEKIDDKVITRYFGKTLSVSDVTKRYEVFDIKAFLCDKIEDITRNFDVKLYDLEIKRGRQSLTLVSDEVVINNHSFHKSFFILNSTDKTRRLSLNLGLYNKESNWYFVTNSNNAHLYKRHLAGINALAEEASKSFNGETFREQLESMTTLVGQSVMLSSVRNIIVDDDTVKLNHKKFDAFKNQLLWRCRGSFNREQEMLLKTPSEKISFTSRNDISIDAFIVFKLYMSIFKKQDAFIVKKESEKIFKITRFFTRQEKLKELLSEL
jgi:hypothetical protein